MMDEKTRKRREGVIKLFTKVVVTCPSCGKCFGAAVNKEEYRMGRCDLDCDNPACEHPKEPKRIIRRWDEGDEIE